MLRNILAASLRNLIRNRLYAAISIGGLAVAFAAATWPPTISFPAMPTSTGCRSA
jgi:hypothetical protein